MRLAGPSPFLLKPSVRESNRAAPEQTDCVLLKGESLLREPDLARRLLEIFRRLRPGGTLRIRLAARQWNERPLTSWTEIVAELLYPHLAGLRRAKNMMQESGQMADEAFSPIWYSLSPATLRAFIRKLFGARLEAKPSPAPTSAGDVSLVWRKTVPLASAFPWRIGEGLPEIMVQGSCAGEEPGLRLQVIAPHCEGPARPARPAKSAKSARPVISEPFLPGLSVIMATLDVKDVLPAALRALAAQSCSPLELVVQDGGSTDGTQACFEAWAKELPFPVRLESRPDCGVYDAWNRALERARGDWTLFLGADDSLHHDVLARALPLLASLDARIDFAYGSLELYRGGKTAAVWDPQPAEALARMRTGMGLPFPATFIRTSLFRTRRFDASYRIAGDFRLVAEAAKPGNLVRLPFCVTRMELGGLSSNPKYHTVTEAERIRVQRELAFRL